MPDSHQTEKKFLEDQLRWLENRDKILEEIETKLYEMRSIAEYARDEKLMTFEIDRLNVQLSELQSEIHILEEQLNVILH